jgi:hypothetical protein
VRALVRFVGTVAILEMQPDRSMVAQRGASAPPEEGTGEGPLGPEQTAPSAVPNEQLELMKMMQQIVVDSMAPMMAKVSDRQDAFERRASMQETITEDHGWHSDKQNDCKCDYCRPHGWT